MADDSQTTQETTDQIDDAQDLDLTESKETGGETETTPEPGDSSESAAEADTQVTDPDGQTEQKAEFDKVRQQVQQELGNKIRPLEDRFAKIEQLLEQQNQQRQETKDELDSIADDELADDTQKLLVQRLKQQDETLKALQTQLEQTGQQYQTQLAEIRASEQRRTFAESHPEIAGKYPDLVKETHQRLEKHFEGRKVSDETWLEVASVEWQRVVQEAEAQAKAEPEKKTVKASDKPDKSSRGATVKKPGTPRTPPDNESDQFPDDELPDLVE